MRDTHHPVIKLGPRFTNLRVILILLSLVLLVPAFGLLVFVADQSRENALNEVKSKALHLARLAAAEEAQIIHSTRQLLQNVAQTPEARRETSPPACDEMVARQIKLYPHYYNLGVIGTSGMRFCSVLTPGQSLDLSGRPYFRRAVETRDFSVGDYQIGASNGKPGISFGYPVIDAAGALRAVVYVVLNLDWFDKSLARTQLPAEAVLSVVDSQGKLLARFPDNDGQVGGAISHAGLQQMLALTSGGTLEGVGANGIRRVWGFVPLHRSASGVLFVRVGIPVAAAYAGIDRAFYRNLALIAAITLLITGVAWAGGERLIMRPVHRLTEAARHLSKGDLSVRTGLPHGEGEFGQLARVFDDMASSIQSEGAALERLMAQQTEANEKLTDGMGELERLNREVTQLSRMSRMLQACQSVEEACEAVAQSGASLFPGEVGALYVMRASRNALEYKAGWGGSEGEDAVIAPESCWALRRGQVYCCEPPHGGLLCAHVTDESPAVPYICVPLVVQSEILGLLYLRFPARAGAADTRPIESRLQLPTTFADQAGLALANLKLREVLKQQSIRDPLTGLHNRRFLEESLERELARAQRSKAPLALIMADVDHFKHFNDTYGHDAGDAVLRSVARTFESHVRGTDIACRFGGEEFTLILPECALDAARAKTEALRQAIAQLQLSHAGRALGAITMSFGLAMLPEQGADPAALLQAADMALYRAKKEGRNRVAVFIDTPVVGPGMARLRNGESESVHQDSATASTLD